MDVLHYPKFQRFHKGALHSIFTPLREPLAYRPTPIPIGPQIPPNFRNKILDLSGDQTF